MKRFVLAAAAAFSLMFAATPDHMQQKAVKAGIHQNVIRNRKYRKLQDSLNEFVAVWQAECKAKGQVLQRGMDQGLICMEAPAPPPASTVPPLPHVSAPQSHEKK